MNSTVPDQIRQIAADVLEIPAERISAASSNENIDNWDSVRHLNLVLALEQQFHLQFEPEEIDEMSSIQNILSVLQRRQKP